ncbi:hypothetical protein ACKKBG_A36760 [Auxenochlorella protothecoides x Auxenochlorella symbiontica]|uniref:Cytochrome c oxidase assembly factor 6-like protein n=1 Tax=Auxenochlorella protothecoides TaxID=3075 RepID=A0A087SID5_AUXPR|nr:hypothetical protein F751_0516 [Auxenochlorella protothecoides]KFM25489.1 hypothetical protein F751_0516 [Auxenochlorella protothecoides]
MSAAADSSVLRAARNKCYQARDKFYSCLEGSGAEFRPGKEAPLACKSVRKEYEASCKASWVKHFDTLHDKRLQLARTLQTNISRSSASSKGSLAGAPQR